jgi:hypothetical protein
MAADDKGYAVSHDPVASRIGQLRRACLERVERAERARGASRDSLLSTHTCTVRALTIIASSGMKNGGPPVCVEARHEVAGRNCQRVVVVRTGVWEGLHAQR